MENEASNEFVDDYFMALCLFAFWTDGSICGDERLFLIRILRLISDKNVELDYDFNFFARFKLARSIEVIEESYPSLSAGKGGVGWRSVSDSLKAILERLDSIVAETLSKYEKNQADLFRRRVFKNITEGFVGLALCDGRLHDGERRVLRAIEQEMPEGLFDVSGLVSSKTPPETVMESLFDPAQCFIANGLSGYEKKRTLFVGNSSDQNPNVYYPLDVAEVSSIEARGRIEELKKGVHGTRVVIGPFGDAYSKRMNVFAVEISDEHLDYAVPTFQIYNDPNGNSFTNPNGVQVEVAILNYALMALTRPDYEEANPAPQDRLAFCLEEAGSRIAPAFLFTTFQKDNGVLLKSHVFAEHEFEAPTYPSDYYEACVDELSEDDRSLQGVRREQIGVVEGWFDGVPEYVSATFVFNPEGEAQLI